MRDPLGGPDTPRVRTMPRTPLILAAVLAAGTASVQAQAHHHPRGAKIIMVGTLADPLCVFAQQLADSAQANCSRQHLDRSFQPALLVDSDLYLLGFNHDADRRVQALQALVGKQVKVDGTVYPAGTAYLIVVDSIRLSSP
ncbi:MAG: hypothetical protein ACREMW_10775 [Gemmatimonadales bacterium]